jgi:molybdate transport system substrate-binding protein
VVLAVALLSAFTLPAGVRAQTLTVAAASDLQAALPGVAARFEKETGARVRLTFGSSGNFFAQIQNGAPFDVFLSADIDYPRQLAARGFGEHGTLTPYATGRLVLWTRRDSGIDVGRGLEALRGPAVRRIAIANPAHAPYGRAAVAALRRAGLYDAVRDRLVMGENISQAAQFAQLGDAEAGIIALSLASGPAMTATGTYAEIPVTLYPPIAQGAIVPTSAREKALARQFLTFLIRPEISAHLHAFGFGETAR